MSEAERAQMRQQMIERMLEQSGLTDREKAAARKTLQSKEQARGALAAELTRLRRVANQQNPSATELQDALAAYRAALAQYHKKTAAEDAALVEQLSLAGQVRCISLGVLDNGMGPTGPGGPPNGRAGGPGAGRSGGPGFGPPPGGFEPPR
jgi:septal ring factor EnvC (AmiA/AmiB activator)